MTKPSNPLADVSAIKLALLARSVRAESRAFLMADPIAIVGMACRVPGADTPDAFWEMLREGRDVIREVPAELRDGGADPHDDDQQLRGDEHVGAGIEGEEDERQHRQDASSSGVRRRESHP